MKNSIKRVQSESSLSALLSARILRKAKLRLTLLAAIPLLMGLTSCQQEEDFAPLGGEAQEICVATRATTYDNNDDGFTEGQVMTVAIESRTNGVWKSDFFKYTYQGGEWISDNPMKVRDFNVLENIYMYIGYSNLNGWELNECLNTHVTGAPPKVPSFPISCIYTLKSFLTVRHNMLPFVMRSFLGFMKSAS